MTSVRLRPKADIITHHYARHSMSGILGLCLWPEAEL
jgi:hypothetical protein